MMHRFRFKRIHESRILASDQTGKVWEVMIIKAGLSHNSTPPLVRSGNEWVPSGDPNRGKSFRYYYDAEMLKRAVPLFDGKPAYAFEFAPDQFNHVQSGTPAEFVKLGPGLAKSKVGQYSNPRWGTDDEGNEGIIATLTLVDDELSLRMREAWSAGIRDFVGYSIDGDGDLKIVNIGGQEVASVTITEINSTDVVTSPAAGGKNLRLVAAMDKPTEDQKPMNPKVRAALFRLLEARKVDKARADRILEADDAHVVTAAVEELKKEAEAMHGQNGMEQAVQLAKEAMAALQAGNADAALAALQKLLEMQAPEPKPQEAAKPPVPNNEPAKTPPAPPPAAPPVTEPAKPAEVPKEPAGANGGSVVPAEQVTKLTEEIEALKAELDQDKATKVIEASNLPEASKEHLKESVRNRVLTAARIKEAITVEQKYLERLGVGNPANMQVSERGRSDALIALEGFFYNHDLRDDQKRPVRRFRSIREAKVKAWQGDPEESAEVFLGSLCAPYHSGERRRLRLREAMTTATFDQAYADVMHKVMLDDYNLPDGNEWRKIVEIASVNDFNDHNFTRIGYWGDLPDVDPDGGTYQELPDLSDEGVAVNVTTKGGMASITRKMIVNDDMRFIRMIPFRLSRAAKGGIRRAVFGTFTANSGAGAVCSYDSLTLIHTSHGNGKTSSGDPLSPTSMSACRVAMMRQRVYGDDPNAPEYLEDLNLPKYLLIPPELETMAISLCKSVNLIQTVVAADKGGGYSADMILPDNPALNIHSRSGMDYILVPMWTNPNNWYAVADPRNVPCIVVAFLKGQEEPELEQEAANTGGNFTARKVTYRVSHDRGIKVIEHRGAHGQVI
ncbi:MAG: hypothetical protein ACOZB3_11045 [Calditrichota bacterium]